MSRRVRHIKAKRNEWIRVHRSGGSRGGNDSLLGAVILVIIGIWLLGVVVRAILLFIETFFPVIVFVLLAGSVGWLIWAYGSQALKTLHKIRKRVQKTSAEVLRRYRERRASSRARKEAESQSKEEIV